MTLHLDKEGFNKEIKYLHSRINVLTKKVAKQQNTIEDLKITIRLLKAKNELLDELETQSYIESKN